MSTFIRYFIGLLLLGVLLWGNSPAVVAQHTTDSIALRYPIAQDQGNTVDELLRRYPIDLHQPGNIHSKVTYDPATDSYTLHTQVGGKPISLPITMTAKEYRDYRDRQLQQAFFRAKNSEILQQEGKKAFNFLDMQFGLGPAEKIFGPGGVQIRTQGAAELSFGMKQTKVNNPTLPAKSRNKVFFDFDEKIQLNVNAKVGDKMSFGMNYNTDATFDFDAQKLKLAYEGKEDEIIQLLEAGSVSMTTGSSLIRGGAALFGIKAQLQFGKLNVTALFAQQESTTQTVSSKGGAQMHPYELSVDAYDANRHYFLAHYFRDTYDQNLSKLPLIASGIEITRLEAWVTNKRGDFDQARHVVAFMDLAESQHRANDYWQGQAANPIPQNQANSLYQTLSSEYVTARHINQVTQALAPLRAFGIEGGQDYEKIESARKLDAKEYTLHKQLGYLSLKAQLQADEVLAVAFEYTYQGQVYQVGEFSTSLDDAEQALYLKLLKGTVVNPTLPLWDLMMKNVYSLQAYQLEKEDFKMQIQYLSDTTGVYLDYLQAGKLQDRNLLQVMGLDRLDRNQEKQSDGQFDFIEGVTVQASSGRIFFPTIEPFGAHLAQQIDDPTLAQKYVFQELYDSTRTVAQQLAEKNKFRLKGEYQSASGAEIVLGAMNVPRGSVVVTAGGMTLKENSDYTVDYTMGVVTILNQSILESGTSIQVSLENQNMYSMQRKTMVGVDMQYNFTKNFTVGGTLVHLSERPLTTKVGLDDIPLKNTIYGFNTTYRDDFMWLTNWVGAVPWINATAPSTFSLKAEYAQLVPGHSKAIEKQGEVYVDDFESSQLGFDIRSPYAWQLASTPYDASSNALFPEAGLSNQSAYGENRARLNWYYIDRLFTQKGSSLTPSHVKHDLEQLSNHYVREVSYREIYPNKDLSYGESGLISVLNLSYYPQERGPYNLDAVRIDDQGNLTDPTARWGGMMRKMDNPDFEAANVEYIQFWVMDPFIYDDENSGELYFNLGEVSEDILKDGMKSFENGLPINQDTTFLATTCWGRVARRTSTVYAFDNTEGARAKQDVGLDGLMTAEEYEFSSYKQFLEQLMSRLSPTALASMQANPFSVINDPASDNFHHFRGSDYDEQERDILARYKYYNNVEGNSVASEESPEKYDISAKTTPDVEDLNGDNTLNEYERYFQYRITLEKGQMQVGQNYISDRKQSRVRLRNGKEEQVNWYQFKIPLSAYEKQVGAIRDFKTIRFMRLFLTGFERPIHLRFASLELMRGDWRTYTKALHPTHMTPIVQGDLNVSVVNIEENAAQIPVNYVMPPGVDRIVDPGQSQITQLNEQSMALHVNSLAPADARAVYKNTILDMRQFKRLQMFIHGESLIDNQTELQDGQLSVFLRLGTDYQDNYYEYEIPLELTPAGSYNGNSNTDRAIVWPKSNMLNIELETLTNLKLERNAEKRKKYSQISFQRRYTSYDPNQKRNKIAIIGNPSLADVRTLMIGVRNTSPNIKSGTVWINELRLADFDEEGGWAGKANVNLGISDLATVNFSGQIETAGFGSVDQSLTERRMDDYSQFNIATSIELGRLLPEKVKLKAPLFYSYGKEVISPEYDPYHTDIKMEQSLEHAPSEQAKDSIKQVAQEVATVKSFSLSGLRFNLQSKNPMPWDPANLTLSYSSTKTDQHDPTTTYERNRDYRASVGYTYSPFIKPWAPFAKGFALQWLPNSIGLYSNLSRSYYEQQQRNLNKSGEERGELPVTFSKNFLWDRQTSIQWNLTKNLNLNYESSTSSRVDEPQVPVNKRLFPDDYEMWKDSIKQSLLKLGTPLNYNQNFNANYTLPTRQIPLLNWTNIAAKYHATYAWNRGVYVDESTQLGNSINNQAQLQGDLRLNFESLYNKSNFLKGVNQKFSSSRIPNRSVNTRKRRFSQRVQLKPEANTLVRHNLDNRNVHVSATNAQRKSIPIAYKVKDRNHIIIETRTKEIVQINITQGKRPEEHWWYQSAQYATRGLMMIRNVSLNYRQTNTTYLPSFDPYIGDFLGQNLGSDRAPGLGFAFGLEGGQKFIDKALEREWLIVNDSLTSPAVYTQTQDLQYRIGIEPFKGLKIDLNGMRVHTRSMQDQFMFESVPLQQSGSFSMTILSISSALRKTNAANGYESKAFTEFVRNREIIATRINQRYAQVRYPNTGFLAGTAYADELFNPDISGAKLNAADVLIPAFLAAYTGRDANKIGLNAFPSLLSIMPNWRVTYSGLIDLIPGMKKYWRSFTLSHVYRSTYNVGSFASYLNWIETEQGLGLTLDPISGDPFASSPFDISTVSISESFAPLLGVDMTFRNGITGRIDYKDSRNLVLNMSSVQLIETRSKDFTLGIGYKIANFNTVFNKKGGGQQGVNHDLILRTDVTHRTQHSLLRKIDGAYTEATSGNRNLTLKVTADYTLSKYLTLRAFFDRQVNSPLVSSSSYPMTTANYGISLKLALTR